MKKQLTLAEFSRKGGQSKSLKKAEAARKNQEKAIAARKLKAAARRLLKSDSKNS